jgi:hypothetical protein
MSVPERILTRHLRELELLGQSEGTIYARRRAIVRMAALIDGPLLLYAAYNQPGALDMVEALPVPGRLRAVAG